MTSFNMDSSYHQINLQIMIDELGEDRVNAILSTFSCPKNKDVEQFLKRKAILFSKQGFSKTFLVFWSSNDQKEKYLIGYYTIANKAIEIEKKSVSNGTYKKIQKFKVASFSNDSCLIPAILIGQLGKNYAAGNDTLIKGKELLKMAVDRIQDIQYEVGGKFAYLECEDKEKLINFYTENGFVLFGKRTLDRDETLIEGEYLMQLLTYIHS